MPIALGPQPSDLCGKPLSDAKLVLRRYGNDFNQWTPVSSRPVRFARQGESSRSVLGRHPYCTAPRYASDVKNIHDSRGRVIATIFDGGPIVNVNDGRGRSIGYSSPNGTYDARGHLVSPQPEQPGASDVRRKRD